MRYNTSGMVPYRADLEPAVGRRQKQVSCVIGVGQLQHTLFETSLVSETKRYKTRHHQRFNTDGVYQRLRIDALKKTQSNKQFSDFRFKKKDFLLFSFFLPLDYHLFSTKSLPSKPDWLWRGTRR